MLPIKILLYMPVNICACILSVLLLKFLPKLGIYEWRATLMQLIAAILVSVLSALFYWHKCAANIWHIPISQAVLLFLLCLILYGGNLLGMYSSGSLGVGFEIAVFTFVAVPWIAASTITAAVYAHICR